MHNAVKWGNYGENPGDRFYRGSSKQDICTQDLYKKGINARESDYLLQIQAGTHDSQNILKDKGPIVSHRSKNTGVSATSSRMNGAIADLQGFNQSLREELQTLKGYLLQTNAKLEQVVTARSGAASQRSQSVLGETARSGVTHRTGRSQRSQSQASWREQSQEGGPDRVTTPMKEWLAQVGNLSGAEVCQPGGKPKRIKQADLKQGSFTRSLVQGTKAGLPGHRMSARASEVSAAINEAREAISRGSPQKK